MSVFIAANRTDDRCVRGPVTIDYRANRARRDKRNVDQRHEHRSHAGPVDGIQASKDRGELAGPIRVVDYKPGGDATLNQRGRNRVRFVPKDYDNIVDARVQERSHDSRDERIAIGQR